MTRGSARRGAAFKQKESLMFAGRGSLWLLSVTSLFGGVSLPGRVHTPVKVGSKSFERCREA